VWALAGQGGLSFEPAELVRFATRVAVYRLEGRRFGVTQSLTDSVWSVAATLEAALVPLGTRDFRVELCVRAHASLLRPRFEIDGFGAIYRVPPGGMAGVVRVAWRID